MASGNEKRRTILAIIATDATFVRGRHGASDAWIGKCLHCGGHLVVGTDGEPISRATIEHILPRSHGGTDELTNLGLACARCNHQKGVRHDSKRRGDARLAEIVAKLAERRRSRWREPDAAVRGSPSRDD